MRRDKFLSSLGLCRRAGKLSVGTEATLLSIRKQQAALVFAAADTSEATCKKLTTACAYYKLPFQRLAYTMGELSDALGVTYSVAAVAVQKSTFTHLFQQ